MSTNKVTTLGYLLKRLRDSGYFACKIFTEYGEADPRMWTIVIDPGVASVFCTCYVNNPLMSDYYLELYDGGQFIPGRLKLKTSSFEVLVEYLVKYGINNKAVTYAKGKQDA
jgi:hypothetical protein